jgi:hypothetical protein
LEGLVDLIDARTKREGPLAILVKLVFVGAQIRQVELAFRDRDQTAHVGTELFFEGRKIDVAVAICVQHVLHQEWNVLFGSIDLVLEEMWLEIFVRDKAITVWVEGLKDLESARLSRAESSIFNLGEKTSKSAGCWLIIDIASASISIHKVFVDEGRGWVSTLLASNH